MEWDFQVLKSLVANYILMCEILEGSAFFTRGVTRVKQSWDLLWWTVVLKMSTDVKYWGGFRRTHLQTKRSCVILFLLLVRTRTTFSYSTQCNELQGSFKVEWAAWEYRISSTDMMVDCTIKQLIKCFHLTVFNRVYVTENQRLRVIENLMHLKCIFGLTQIWIFPKETTKLWNRRMFHVLFGLCPPCSFTACLRSDSERSR